MYIVCGGEGGRYDDTAPTVAWALGGRGYLYCRVRHSWVSSACTDTYSEGADALRQIKGDKERNMLRGFKRERERERERENVLH